MERGEEGVIAHGDANWTPAAGGGDASLTKQNEIINLLTAKVINVHAVSTVIGDTIHLVSRNDYTGDEAIELVIDDVGGVIHGKLAGAIETQFVAGLREREPEIVGTVSSSCDGRTEKTTVKVEIAQANTSDIAAAVEMPFLIQWADENGNWHTVVGSLVCTRTNPGEMSITTT